MSYCSDLLVVILSFVVLICIKKVTNGDPRPIYNIYQQKPNFYWLKVFFIYTILQLRKFKTASKRRKLGVVEKEKEWGKLEQPQKLSSHQNVRFFSFLNIFLATWKVYFFNRLYFLNWWFNLLNYWFNWEFLLSFSHLFQLCTWGILGDWRGLLQRSKLKRWPPPGGHREEEKWVSRRVCVPENRRIGIRPSGKS